MSGTGDGSLIATTRNAELQVLGTGGQLAVQAWDQISGYLRRARSPAHAALFAEPNPDADRGITDWYAGVQGAAPPLESLPDAAQEAARAEFARLYGDIREEADRLRASTRESERFLGELLSLALITPATDCLRVVGGQPVLVAWGHAKLGEAPSPELLIGMTRRRGGAGAMQIVGPPAAPPEKRSWLSWLLGLLGLLLLLLLLLLLWRDPFGWFRAALPQCVVQPGNAELLDELRAAQAREAALRADIAGEMLRLGDRRTACPPPEPPPRQPPPEPPRVTPPPPPPPPPRPTPPPRPAERPLERPPNVEPCNTEVQSGGRGITETRHYLGPTPGRVTITYNTRMEPDRIRVYHRGRSLAETPGFVSGNGAISFDWNPPPGGSAEDYVVTVEVMGTPGSPSTRWDYRIGCPGGGR